MPTYKLTAMCNCTPFKLQIASKFTRLYVSRASGTRALAWRRFKIRASPVAQEVYAQAICEDASATLDDVRKAVTTLAEAAPHARRVFGNAHPTAVAIERSLRISQAVLRGREALGPGADPSRRWRGGRRKNFHTDK